MSPNRVANRAMVADENMRKIAMKHASLKPDYLELQRETRAMKKRLQRAKLKKDNLLAEVRYLRRRLKMLKQTASNSKGLEELHENQPMETRAMDIRLESATRATACKDEAAGTVQEPYSPLDSRQSSQIVKSSASREEFQVIWEPLRRTSSTFPEAAKKSSVVDSNGFVSTLKSSLFKDSSNGFVTPMTGKRKISWQDQISLKV